MTNKEAQGFLKYNPQYNSLRRELRNDYSHIIRYNKTI